MTDYEFRLLWIGHIQEEVSQRGGWVVQRMIPLLKLYLVLLEEVHRRKAKREWVLKPQGGWTYRIPNERTAQNPGGDLDTAGIDSKADRHPIG